MNKFIKGSTLFVMGAAIGSIVTYFYTKNKLTLQYAEELNEFKQTYTGKPNLEDCIDNSLQDCEDIIEKEGYSEKRPTNEAIDYTTFTKQNNDKKGPTDMKQDLDVIDLPTVIAPEEYGEYMDYEQIELTYYSDGVVAGDNDIALSQEEIIESLGEFFADHFGEYEDDSVYVRNDVKRCEYQILKDERTFEEVTQQKYGY